MTDIKAIIFDVDGVTFTTHDTDDTYLWTRTIKKDLGLEEKVHIQKIFSSEWHKVLKGQRDALEYLDEVFQGPLFQELKITPKQYIDYWLAHDNCINRDVLDLVKSINVPCYLGTNQERRRTNHILKLVGEYFRGCFTSYAIGHMKPELEFFEHIEKSLNLEPTELLLIDDTVCHVQGAKARGWQTYLYQNNLEDLKSFLSESFVIRF